MEKKFYSKDDDVLKFVLFVIFQKSFGLHFDDPGWQQYLSSLKPLVRLHQYPRIRNYEI